MLDKDGFDAKQGWGAGVILVVDFHGNQLRAKNLFFVGSWFCGCGAARAPCAARIVKPSSALYTGV